MSLSVILQQMMTVELQHQLTNCLFQLKAFFAKANNIPKLWKLFSNPTIGLTQATVYTVNCKLYRQGASLQYSSPAFVAKANDIPNPLFSIPPQHLLPTQLTNRLFQLL